MLNGSAHLHESAWQRARRDTPYFPESKLGRWLEIIVVTVVTTGVPLWMHVHDLPPWFQVGAALVTMAISAFAVFGLMFLANLVRAPCLQRDEARAAIAVLEAWSNKLAEDRRLTVEERISILRSKDLTIDEDALTYADAFSVVRPLLIVGAREGEIKSCLAAFAYGCEPGEVSSSIVKGAHEFLMEGMILEFVEADDDWEGRRFKLTADGRAAAQRLNSPPF